jgi:hypothetical protein
MCGWLAAPTPKIFHLARGAHDSRPSPRGRHGIASASIRLEKVSALFEARRCEPVFVPGAQNAIGAAMEALVEMF